ncbi:hypothetical protein HHI36_005047 [Cryptolaemus montrouzieri]|uniref:Uncharacterized protein n=1 Tax=Cryptolaemus montrouzieri TaxID=559131 RepID=A0ABD2NTI7_9CUCU
MLGHMHVCKLDSNLTEDQISEHLRENGFQDVRCIKMESKRPDEYSSFRHGGVTVLVKYHTHCKELNSFKDSTLELHFEVAGIEKAEKNAIVVTLYKTQEANIDLFFLKLGEMLNIITVK